MNPRRKASWKLECFSQTLKSEELVTPLRLTDGTVDGGAARTEWWRQEKQVVPGVRCGMS